MTATAINKTLLVGKTDKGGDVEIEVQLEDGRLSIVGNVWLKSRRDIEAGGQLEDGIREYLASQTMPEEKLSRILAIWKRWHLNDLKAGCGHQRANWDVSQQLEVVHYGLTSEAQRLRTKTREALATAALKGETLNLDPTAKALAELDAWYKHIPTPPNADSPLSGCYEVKKRETKAAGWAYPTEHPLGVLTKPCEVCGYKYGSAWLKEELPADVIAEVESW